MISRVLLECGHGSTQLLRALALGRPALSQALCSLTQPAAAHPQPLGHADQQEGPSTSGSALPSVPGAAGQARQFATAAQEPGSSGRQSPQPPQQPLSRSEAPPRPFNRRAPGGQRGPGQPPLRFQERQSRPGPGRPDEGFAQFSERNRQLTNLKQRQAGIISVLSTTNNTIITLADLQGRVQAVASAGSLGFTNSRKKTTHAAEAVAAHMGERAHALGFTTVEINVKGMGYGKQRAVKVLHGCGLQVTAIHEKTPIPHNGCRLPRKRRI